MLHSSWQEIKLGTQSSLGIINPRWQRMHDNYKQKLCHSPWGKQLQGWQAMLNINMDHRTKDLVTDATAVFTQAGSKARRWRGRENMNIDGAGKSTVSDKRHCHIRDDLTSSSKVRANIEDIRVIMYTGAAGTCWFFIIHRQNKQINKNESKLDVFW